MATARDVILAQLSANAYSNEPTPLPTGFAPVSSTDLGLVLDAPGESFANGLYRNGNAAALVTRGTLDGQPTLVLTFRGSDDREDSVADLRDINSAYPDFAELVAAVDAHAARGGFAQLAVTGHSLGGALTQLAMAERAAGGDPVPRVASTFGSPGALITDGPDARITNYAIADDPAVFLGENRAAVGAELRSDPVLAAGVILFASDFLPGLTSADAAAALPTLTVDYENRGETVVLPGRDGTTTRLANVEEAREAGEARHDVDLYLAEVSAAAGVTPMGLTRDGASVQELAPAYAGPVAGLQWQFLGTAVAEAVRGTGGGDFINLLGGDDAANGGAGDDVLDGGTGSNFLTGGDGREVFFLDGRAAAAGGVTWSTIADFAAGEQLSLFGWRPGVSRGLWVDSDGAAGFQGATLHVDLDGSGGIDTSVTWAGLTRAALPGAREFDGLFWFA
jgi:Lipase (class 3)